MVCIIGIGSDVSADIEPRKVFGSQCLQFGQDSSTGLRCKQAADAPKENNGEQS